MMKTMTDAELIARLRKADEYEPLGHDGWEAADRIEALTKEREQWRRAAETRAEGWKISDDARIEAEIKLAKALEGQKIKALEQILEERGAVFDAMVDAAEDAAGKDVSFNVVVGRALRAAIAEIKGESHD
jgi:hypothetical protein